MSHSGAVSVAEPPQITSAPPQKLHQALTDESKSALQRYRNIVLGRGGLWELLKYELIMLFIAPLPGAIGLTLRKLFFPLLLGEVGSNVIFGRNLTIRHGSKIRLGDRVVLDDNVVLDAKGSGNRGITIGADTIISRNCVLSCKGADIWIGRNSTIGMNSLVHAVEGSDVTVGDHAAIAAYVYLIGGGNYRSDRVDIPMREQGTFSKGGIVVCADVWVGSHVQVLDGVTVGRGSILAAGAVVHRDVPEFSVVGGVPAKILQSRRDNVTTG